MRKTKFLHSVLEKSGRVNLQCSFTYDFSLHETLKVWWEVQKGDEKFQMKPEDVVENGKSRIFGSAFKGRAVYISYPYRKVSTIYMILSFENVFLRDDGNYTCHSR